jgi:hypothetical protein
MRRFRETLKSLFVIQGLEVNARYRRLLNQIVLVRRVDVETLRTVELILRKAMI